MQARVTVVDDAIRDFMLSYPQEGISVTLTNPQKQVVLERIVKPEEVITYQSQISNYIQVLDI